MSSDIFIPSSAPEDALVKPLHTVTYLTSDKAAVEKMFVAGMELEMSGWNAPSKDQREQLNHYFGFSKGDIWEVCSFYRSGDLSNINVRVICVSDDKPQVRPEVDGLYFGGATIGFPMADIDTREQKMSGANVKSSVGVKNLEFTNTEGQTYVSSEIHFIAPENIFVLGVKRPDIFVQIGPMDEEQGIGAAAYSCRCVPDLDEVNKFCVDVLGYELRRDMTMSVGPNSGLKLEEGLEERFAQAFAPGSGTGYLVFLEHGGKGKASPTNTYGPPNRGVVMWSFSSNHIDEVYRRAQQAGVEIIQAPLEQASPHLPKSRTLLLKDPSGFPIEIFEV